MRHFVDASRGQIIMACGTGKTLTALWIAQGLKAKNIIVALPSLQLQYQSITTWIAEAESLHFSMLAIGSDNAITKHFGVPSTTSAAEIEDFLSVGQTKIIFTTYQSSPQLVHAANRAGITFDLAIIDEAHRTAGREKKLFGRLLNDKKGLSIKRRLFMTATPRFFEGDGVVSMDDESVYGKVIYRLTTEDAIRKGILSDYKLLVLWMDESLVGKATLKHRRRINNVVAPGYYFALVMALKKAMIQHGFRRIISFHKSIDFAKAFQSIAISERLNAWTINSGTKIAKRKEIIQEYSAADTGLITNPKVLLEGFDLPEIDTVAFVDARKSHFEVIQAIGRCLRRYEGKERGYVLLPIFINDNGVINQADFKNINATLSAMGANDGRIRDALKKDGLRKKGQKDGIIHNMVIGRIEDHVLSEIREKINVRTWQRLRLLNKLPYLEVKSYALEMAEKYGIDTKLKWDDFAKGLIPGVKIRPDISPRPDYTYMEEFEGWTTFLGRQKRGFAEARDLARELAKEKGIDSLNKWMVYMREHRDQYPDIRIVPGEYEEYVDAYDFFGTERPQGEYYTYAEAKIFARNKLAPNRINTKEKLLAWAAGADSRISKPKKFPANPQYIYRDEWEGFAEFLGTSKDDPNYRSFDLAREYAIMLCKKYGIDSNKKWKDWHMGKIPKTPKPPKDIPLDARMVYLHKWRSWGFFFGFLDREGNKI